MKQVWHLQNNRSIFRLKLPLHITARCTPNKYLHYQQITVIVSSVLPKKINCFGCYNGVWVTDFGSAVGLASALRESLIQVAFARNALIGKNEKNELMYNYLTSSAFKQRIEAIVEAFTSMKEDLDSEKRAMEKIWSKREAQITRVVKNTAGMYGDMQGIIGSSLPEIKLLQLPGDEEE
ncbi:MAG: DUF2130 domain-containing protein [Bacteroidetes bacterium]|nr:DUF2130 domain-containing protein [Bacteroidota bacterium]MBU1422498.1 DUF2130 domain-containing protein [Bacteroidota bacterium]MBU2470831.1 DUF2130 domain-containing protein [Bacteroidota bacterium]MBU2636865.1 DUF2130 domain-containing protein [Bacteroidota bacterium]